MKIAIGIISLVWMILVFFQSCAAGIGGSIGDDPVTSSASSFGILGAVTFLIGGALSFAVPLGASIVFFLGSAILLNAELGDFKDLQFHGYVLLVFGVLSLVTWYLNRKTQNRTTNNSD
jgi:hypothetical protein